MALAGYLLKPFMTRRLIQFIFKYSCPKPHFNVCQRNHKNSRVQKGDSRLPSKAFSDAAFIYAYLQMLLPKAALHTYVGEITKTAAFKKAKASYLYCLF